MKIIDETGAVITAPNLELGYLVEDTETVHHDAVKAVEEVSHYETVTEYPNGGRDVRRVVDTPGVEAREAYDETVAIQRYIRYTDDELALCKRNSELAGQESRAPSRAELARQITNIQLALCELYEGGLSNG